MAAGDTQRYNITDLRPNTNYTMAIKAYNRGGSGPASIEVLASTDEEAGKLNSLLLFVCVAKFPTSIFEDDYNLILQNISCL